MDHVNSTTSVKTYYQLLGVPRSVTPDALASAWRKKAAKTHPDRGGNATEFQTLRDAYEVLRDPEERALYDARLDYEEKIAQQPKPGEYQRPMGYTRPEDRYTTPPKPTVRKRTPARNNVLRGWPKIIRDNAYGAVIIVAVGWFSWALSRVGVLHTKIPSAIFAGHLTPSLSGLCILASLSWAIGLSYGVSLLARRAGVRAEFITWVLCGLCGLYIEPFAWYLPVQEASAVALVALGLWYVLFKSPKAKLRSIGRRTAKSKTSR